MGGTFRTNVHSVTAEIGGTKGGQPGQGSSTNCVSPGLGSLCLSCPFFKGGIVAGFLGLLGLGALLGPQCPEVVACVPAEHLLCAAFPNYHPVCEVLSHPSCPQQGDGETEAQGVTCGPKKCAVSSQLLPGMSTEGSWQGRRGRGEPGALRSLSPCACP